MSLCFAGVVAIALSKTNQTLASSNKFLGICVSFSTAWFLALVGVLNRRLKNVHYTVVSFWHPFTGTIFSFLYVLYMLIAKGTVFEVHQWQGYLLTSIAGFCDFISLVTINIAYQSDSSGFISILGYMSVFYSFLSDYFIFSQPLSGFDLVGALCILIVTLSTSIYKLKTKQKS